MSSQQKIDSARANGAKSHGPKTDAGRKISSQNAVTHGLYANAVVLPSESHEQYQETLDAYLQQFQPEGPIEHDLIEEMVAAKWRQRRLWAIEADLLEVEMLEQKAEVDAKYTGYDAITPLSFAYAALAKSTSLPFLTRNESRLERAYNRALKMLLDLQRLRQPTNQNVQKRTQPNHHEHTPASNEKRETRNEKRETSNQPPATRNQPQPTTHHPQP
jgi:predicted nucleic acid-binding protein